MTINEETAQLLKKVAAVFRVKEGDTFRYKAYINAAIAIENLTEPITEVWKRGEPDTIPGLGENLIVYLEEYFSTGHVRHFESQFKKVPAGMFSLMTIRGIGPMTAYKIAHKFHLNREESALADLKEILKSGQLEKIQSFKAKTVAKIQKALDIQSFGKARLPLYEALPVAEDLLSFLLKSPDISVAETLGSLRRRLSTVGDIDIAFCSASPQKAMAYALTYPQISAVVSTGDKVSHIKLNNGLEVDLKISAPNSWGSLLQHYTGSKLHNIHLRTLAKEKGLSLSEYGITQNKKLNRFTTETGFYKFLGMSYIQPEIRENNGEIELAQKHQLPKLIELSDIKGDLHIHSDFNYPSSHDLGISPLSQLLQSAEEKNYEYIGLSDHNPKFVGLTESQKLSLILDRKKYLELQYHAYEKSVKHRTINLLIGLEVDIRPDGDLALSDKILDQLDYAIVSIHSSFALSEKQNTQRIIRALSHPKALILGHPTGRVINGRQSISANWDQIFAFCAQNHKIIEINAYPTRLDLPDDLIRKAVAMGVKLIINTDSHEVSQMANMQYGVWNARRGYAEKIDIVNTLSFKDLHSVLE
jgi:DNA polymerase (family X)